MNIVGQVSSKHSENFDQKVTCQSKTNLSEEKQEVLMRECEAVPVFLMVLFE